ncbi:MAG TPA: radical SAM protein [Firmicutes bacterium]|nr:radical SAM protein [Bacillota bacterium]
MEVEVTCKSALVKTGIPGYDYCLNPYSGCSHGCRYCYAETVLRFRREADRWGEYVAAKVNFPEVLRRELRRRRRNPGGPAPVRRVLFGTVTDAYQRAEKDFGLTRSSLEALADLWPEAEVCILTKSGLVRRDVDVIKRLKGCSVGFTITLVDDAAAALFEPGAPPPSIRLETARELLAEGIPVWVFIAPLLPGIGDAPRALEQLLAAIRAAGVAEVHVDPLNPYPTAVRRLKALYRTEFPWAERSLDGYLRNQRAYLDELAVHLEVLSHRFGYDLRLA